MPGNRLSVLLVRLWKHITVRRRTQLFGLLAFMVLASFAEVLSLGALIPFLGVLSSPETVFQNDFVQTFAAALGITQARDLLLPLTIAFGTAALITGGMRLLLLWGSTRLSVLTGAELSIDMYRRTLYQPYPVHLARNSSEVINAISTKTGATIHIMLMIMNLISSIFILTTILIALLAADTVVALVAIVGFSAIYVTVVMGTRRSLQENSERVARETSLVIKSLQEGLGGIRDVLLDGTQAVYSEVYQQSDIRARMAQGNSSFLAAAPRFAVEALAMLFIAGLAYFMAREPSGLARAIPVLGVLALGAQRMLPIMQQAYASWASIKSNQGSLADALDMLDQPLPPWAGLPPPSAMPFAKQLELSHVTFRYGPDAPAVLNDLSLVVPRGSRIGIIGATGSGKSTLLDVVMGLLPPSQGEFLVDGVPVREEKRRSWQAHVAHVPQSVFLADKSVEENIAFGVLTQQIDRERVRKAARQAQIAETIEKWPDQYRTVVGERGARLSGGQKQRIGIARALYKKADVIIFDEATSALDSDTELAVMRSVESLSTDLTIFLIAHRTSTLRSCDRIYELRNGVVAWTGTYDEIATRDAVPSRTS